MADAVYAGDVAVATGTLTAASGTITITGTPKVTIYDPTGAAIAALTDVDATDYDHDAAASVDAWYRWDTVGYEPGVYTVTFRMAYQLADAIDRERTAKTMVTLEALPGSTAVPSLVPTVRGCIGGTARVGESRLVTLDLECDAAVTIEDCGLTITLPDGTAGPTISTVDAAPASGSLVVLRAGPVSIAQAGIYRLAWSFSVAATGEAFAHTAEWFASWGSVGEDLRGLRKADAAAISDRDIAAFCCRTVRRLEAQYPALVYRSLTGADRYLMDDVLALMGAAGIGSAQGATGALSSVKQGDVEFRYEKSASAGSASNPDWLKQADETFRRISVVASAIASTRSNFAVFALAGRRRVAETAGYVSTYNVLYDVLADEEAAEDASYDVSA